MIVKTFSGDFFDCLLSSNSVPPRYRIHIFPSIPFVEPDISVIGLHCANGAARSELMRLLKLASCLANFLESGGTLERWTRESCAPAHRDTTRN
jgi:hypothetical protein